MVYLGHRKFVESDNHLHDDKVNFPSKENSCQPLSKKTMNYMNLANERYDHARTSGMRKRIVRKTGCKGAYILWKLPHHERYLDTPVEPMHLIKTLQNILFTYLLEWKIQCVFS